MTKKNMTEMESTLWHIHRRLRSLEDTTETLTKDLKECQVNATARVSQVRPVCGKPKGTPITLDHETERQMAIQAQYLGLRGGAEELSQIVLHAFLEMADLENVVHLPLALTQVEVS